MTREEAKTVLYEWQKSMVKHGVPLDTSKVQALRVAIEALSSETVHIETYRELYEKYVELKHASAKAVQGDGKMIPIELKKRYPHSRDEDITDAFMRGYKSAQAVQGEWIDVNGDGSLWRCDQCKDTACCNGNFCPTCGAKMKGGDSE